MIMMAWCREEAKEEQNRTAMTVQEVEAGGRTYYLAALCEAEADEAVGETAREAAQRVTEWFYSAFAGRRFVGKKRVARRMEACALTLLGISVCGRKRQKSRGGKLSLEWILVRGRNVFYCHYGSGSCCRIRGQRAKRLRKPQADTAYPAIAVQCWRRRRSEGWIIGSRGFMQAWQFGQLGKVWSGGMQGEETGRTRMGEMRDKVLRSGKDQTFAAVGTWADERK